MYTAGEVYVHRTCCERDIKPLLTWTIIIISRKTVKITSGFSILIRQFYALIDNLIHELLTVCTKQVRFPYTEHTASGILNPYSLR